MMTSLSEQLFFHDLLVCMCTVITVIISQDKSQAYIGFPSVAPRPYVLTCVCDNSNILSWISFKLATHMNVGEKRNPILSNLR